MTEIEDIFDALERKARHWLGVTLEDTIENRPGRAMITIEMTQAEWCSLKKRHLANQEDMRQGVSYETRLGIFGT